MAGRNASRALRLFLGTSLHLTDISTIKLMYILIVTIFMRFHLNNDVFPLKLFLITTFFLLTSLIIAPCVLPEGTGDYPPPEEGDWIVSEDTHVRDETIVLNGDLIVLEDSSLTLENVTLIINSSMTDLHGVTVNSGGRMDVIASNITASPGAALFEVYGDMVMELSSVSHMYTGIEIFHGEVYIANSTIFDNSENGILCEGNPIIYNNTIHSNLRGVVSNYTALPRLYNNSISHNGCGVLGIAMGSGILIGNGISNNTNDGINQELGYFELRNNTIASNGGFGIRGDHSIFIASGNLIYDNARWGLYSSGGSIIQENNTFEMDGKMNIEGDVLQEWEVLIQIMDKNNNAVEDVNITVTDKYGSTIWTGQTISSVRRLVLREYEIGSGGSELVHSPFTISARKGDLSNSTVVDVNNNQIITVILEPEDNGESMDLWMILIAIIVVIVVGLIVVLRKRIKR